MAVVFQHFTAGHKVRVWVACVVEKVGEDGATGDGFEVFDGVSGFHDDQLMGEGGCQLSESEGGQFEYVVVDG